MAGPDTISFTDFLSTYAFFDEVKRKTLPEWIFNVSSETRRRLELIEEFPLRPEDMVESRHTAPRGGTRAHLSSPCPSPPPGQAMPSLATTPGVATTTTADVEHGLGDMTYDDNIPIRLITTRRSNPIYDPLAMPSSSAPEVADEVAENPAENLDAISEGGLSDHSIARRHALIAAEIVYDTSTTNKAASSDQRKDVLASIPNNIPGSAFEGSPRLLQQSQQSQSLTQSFSASQRSNEDYSLSRYLLHKAPHSDDSKAGVTVQATPSKSRGHSKQALRSDTSPLNCREDKSYEASNREDVQALERQSVHLYSSSRTEIQMAISSRSPHYSNHPQSSSGEPSTNAESSNTRKRLRRSAQEIRKQQKLLEAEESQPIEEPEIEDCISPPSPDLPRRYRLVPVDSPSVVKHFSPIRVTTPSRKAAKSATSGRKDPQEDIDRQSPKSTSSQADAGYERPAGQSDHDVPASRTHGMTADDEELQDSDLDELHSNPSSVRQPSPRRFTHDHIRLPKLGGFKPNWTFEHGIDQEKLAKALAEGGLI